MPDGAHSISRDGFLENFTTHTWEGLEHLRMVLRGRRGPGYKRSWSGAGVNAERKASWGRGGGWQSDTGRHTAGRTEASSTKTICQ